MKAIIGITMGDIAGIGPEIIAKALTLKELYEMCQPLVIGDASVMERALTIADVKLDINRVLHVSEAVFKWGTIDVLDLKNVGESIDHGHVHPASGRASAEYIEKAVILALNGEIDAITTAPISKEAINMAGYHYSGHTEFLAHLTNTANYTMLLTSSSLRVVHVTTHVSLREACDMVKYDRVLRTIILANDIMRKLGFEKPRIAVASLNPHCGEGGLFGKEEIEEIAPSIRAAKELGLNVSGPLPPDTVFIRARGGAFDIVVAMYHDQGHIPVKFTGFEWNEGKNGWSAVGGVNTTVGLPIVRTSVDHGVAYGKAGTGTANAQSMVEAIVMASKLVGQRLRE
jgi:4-hydroxythreonine-4-phosphate dehydrogenase